eukprot:571391-Prymnesium_polylepis.2
MIPASSRMRLSPRRRMSASASASALALALALATATARCSQELWLRRRAGPLARAARRGCLHHGGPALRVPRVAPEEARVAVHRRVALRLAALARLVAVAERWCARGAGGLAVRRGDQQRRQPHLALISF